ncbi:MAG TPA: hypothetical protein VH278_03285 [Burkholderiaceae bacterium]|nr:hypothetical protein [Burkholderiaceae bacterium]
MNVQRMQATGMAWRALRVAACLFAAGFGTHTFALGLGEPSVTSVLGQPLQMTVPLVISRDTELTQDCVQIVPGSRDGEPTPTLSAARLTIDAVNRKLRIESALPITEPTLRVVVELGCNERIRREFVVLLDPPSMVAPDVKTGALAEAGPLGLGMAQISAVLGQRLSIKVPVVGSEASSLTGSCVHLTDPASTEGAPVLRQADIRVVPKDAGALIELVTPDAVTQPTVRLALDVGCHDPLRREYAIMLGMPTLAASNADTTVGAGEPSTPPPVPRPAPKRPAHKAVPPAPAAPQQRASSEAALAPEAPAKAPPAAASNADRFVLGSSSQDSIGPVASGADIRAIAPDASAELLKRMDVMSRQIEALQAQLAASRQREQELERKTYETRAPWAWSAGALGGLLLGGALVMVWRQRRPAAQATWEPLVTRPAQTRPPRSIMARSTGSRESPEIGGRATMPPSSSMGGLPTEPSLTDEKHTQITVTELHDTVQVIKELYATVLERNTAAGSSTTGKPHAPLELDLRTPTRMNPPVASPAARAGQDHAREADQRALDERFTELPTEVGLDLDLNTSAAPAPELTDLLVPGNTGRAPARTEAPAAATASPAPAVAPAGAVRAQEANMPAADLMRPDAGGRRDLSDDQLTQTPTELSIDIDV